MNNWGIKKTDPSDDISTNTWINYFNKLVNDTNACVIEEHEEQRTFEPSLDGRISSKELREAIGNLKGGKAAGPDEVISEYLRIFGLTFEDILLKLVNVIFSNHIYPAKWA